MTLEVKSQALRAFGKHLGANASEVPTAATYTETWLAFSGASDGIFVGTTHMNDEVKAHLATLWSKLERLLDSCDAELRNVAHYYDTTDHQQAVRYDHRMEAVATAPGSGYADQHSDVTDTVPVEPEDYEPPEEPDDTGGPDDPALQGIVPAI